MINTTKINSIINIDIDAFKDREQKKRKNMDEMDENQF